MQQRSHGSPVDDDRLCGGTTRRGNQCWNPPLEGQWFCPDHGGRTRLADAAASSPAAAAFVADFRRRMDALRARLKAR
jgi:hypothetical protein